MGRFGAGLVATERRAFLVVAVLVLLSRLPFLDAGYGAIRDAWRVASVARLIATTGEYRASRFPPHPVHEIASALLWRGGPVALNLATAAVSALGIGFFALAARRLKYEQWFIASLAVAFTPQIYIASTSAIDYMWALGFVFAALYFVVRANAAGAGLAVALAIGSRITSGAVLLPFSVLVAQRSDDAKGLRRIATLWSIALLLGTALLMPAFLRYGSETLTFAEVGDIAAYEVFRKATLETWGAIGTLAISLACGYQVVSLTTSRTWRSRARAAYASYAHVWLLAIALYTLAFLRLPHLPAYLIPAIPFMLLFLHTFLNRKPYLLVCVALLVSSFVGFGRSGAPREGAILHDRKTRTERMEAARRFVAVGNALPGRNVVVAGHWYANVYVYVLEHPDDSTRYVYLLSMEQAERYRREGTNIYYMPGQRELNMRRHDLDLHDYGALPLIK